MRERIEAGHYVGPIPYGYQRRDREFVHDRKIGRERERETGPLVPHPQEAELVRRIFREYVAGKSQRQIARDLVRDGVKTKRGGRWSQAIVARVLANAIYVGELRHGIAGQHEPIVDRALWDEAERLRAGLARTKGGGRGNVPKGRHLFRHGTLRCGRCGEAMVPRTIRPRSKTGRWYEAYLCYSRILDREACDQPPVPRGDIDGAFFRYFETVALDVEATRAQFDAEHSRQLAESKALRDRAQREESEAAARLARVRRDYQDGKIDADDWREQRDELAAELDAARAQVARLAEQAAQLGDQELPDAELAVLEYLTELRAAIAGRMRERDNLDGVRAALLTLFDRFTLHRFDSDTGPPIVPEPLVVGGEDGYVLEPTVSPDMVARVVAVHYPSGAPAAVEPVRAPLAGRHIKDAQGRPYVYEELVARMRAVLRRANGRPRARVEVGELAIDLAARTVRGGGCSVQLSAKEYELLVALADDPERVFTKEELLRGVWGFRSLGRTRTLDSHASRLRRKLNDGGPPAYVRNVWGVGYQLVPPAG